MEAQIAANSTIPRVMISKKGQAVSRMFKGVFSPTVEALEYDDVEDLKPLLIKRVPFIVPYAIESAEKRRPILRDFERLSVGRMLLKQRIIRGISLAELAGQTDTLEFWLSSCERDPQTALNTSWMQLSRIVQTLGCGLRSNIDPAAGSGRLEIAIVGHAENDLTATQKTSLENLVSFSLKQPEPLADDRVLRIWSEYRAQDAEQLSEAGRFRSSDSRDGIISEDDWKRRYDSTAGLFP